MTRLFALTFQGGGLPNTTPVPPMTISFPSSLGGAITVNLQHLLSNGLTLALVAAVLLALGFFIYGGLRWIMSVGDKKKLEEAQKTLQYAIIGLLIVLLAFFIINFIGMVFGVSLLKVTFQ